MPFRSGQIHEAPLREHEDPTPVLERVALVIGAEFLYTLRQGREVLQIQFAVVVARIAHDRAVLHKIEVTTNDHVFHPGGCNEEVSDPGRLFHRHHGEAIERGPQCFDRLDLRHDDVRTHPAGAGGASAAAVAVPRYDEGLPSQQYGGSPQDPVYRGLTGAEHVVEVPLRLGVVHRNDRVEELSVVGHGPQPVHARGRLLGPAAEPSRAIRVIPVQPEDEIGPVVQRECWLEPDRLFDTPVELIHVHPVPREDRDPVGGQRRSDLVLCGEWVATRPGDLRSSSNERSDQNGGLLGDVQTPGDALSFERPLFLELPA